LAENVSDEKIVNFTYVACELSIPELTAIPGGYKVELGRAMGNNTNIVEFNVLRKSFAQGNYQVIARTGETGYTDEKAVAVKKYWCIVQAVDKYNNTVSSKEMTCLLYRILRQNLTVQVQPTTNIFPLTNGISKTELKFRQ
jgi:hypothetical protein